MSVPVNTTNPVLRITFCIIWHLLLASCDLVHLSIPAAALTSFFRRLPHVPAPLPMPPLTGTEHAQQQQGGPATAPPMQHEHRQGQASGTVSDSSRGANSSGAVCLAAAGPQLPSAHVLATSPHRQLQLVYSNQFYLYYSSGTLPKP